MNEKKIEMNMLRDRSDRLPNVTDKMFESCNPHNVTLVKQYLESSNNLSKQTLKQYRSGMYQFVYWLKENAMDKPFYKVKKFDFKRYMSYLISRGMSSSSLSFKKSAVSAFCAKFLEVFIVEEMEEYATFRNFTTGVIDISKNQTYDKIPITKDEYDLMMNTLIDDENYMGACWVAVMWRCGCRLSEAIQFKSEIVNYDSKGKTYVMSHIVRGKGSGEDGKPLEYMIPLDVLPHIKKWLDVRGYEHEYIFTTNKTDPHVISPSWGDSFCANVLSDILGRRINPHRFKGSCATYLLESGVDIKLVSKYVCHHNDVSTTQNFYDLRDDSEEKDAIFF